MTQAATSGLLTLTADAVTNIYRSGPLAVHAMAGVSLTLYDYEMVLFLGASGSGKSTLLNILRGLNQPTSGCVMFRDQDLTSLGDAAMTAFRRAHVGFVFQFYNLVHSLTARENAVLVTEIADCPMRPVEALKRVGLSARLDHFPSELSGVRQQYRRDRA